MYSDSLEETVKSLLQLLGKLNRPNLTVVEEKLLTLSMEISPQRDSKEVKLYEGCGKTFRNWCPVLCQL
ncbi:hypothetical protein [Nostoc sp. FACHB-888]|uniref:hypothetical protein n=2 Tax=unclassified Nostoc TaxID=2593658 RepID=UPI0016823E43|nr:hypothetical protein [Nostoc sp. FACHB-888]MBD2248690.1 hypothetical protein [Nostoc sp. FACHB-888]